MAIWQSLVCRPLSSAHTANRGRVQDLSEEAALVVSESQRVAERMGQLGGTMAYWRGRGVWPPHPPHGAGSIRSRAPSSSSVSRYRNPSGPSRTFRIRCLSSVKIYSRRNSSVLSLKTIR